MPVRRSIWQICALQHLQNTYPKPFQYKNPTKSYTFTHPPSSYYIIVWRSPAPVGQTHLPQQTCVQTPYNLELRIPASNEVPLAAASARYWQGLKKPDRPAAWNCVAHPSSLAATCLAPIRSAHLISPPLHQNAPVSHQVFAPRRGNGPSHRSEICLAGRELEIPYCSLWD